MFNIITHLLIVSGVLSFVSVHPLPWGNPTATRVTKIKTVAYDPEDDPADYTPSSTSDYQFDDTLSKTYGELIWPGLDDIDEEIEFYCKDKYGTVAEEIDDCEIVEEEDIKTFVQKYNDQWIKYYTLYHGSDDDELVV